MELRRFDPRREQRTEPAIRVLTEMLRVRSVLTCPLLEGSLWGLAQTLAADAGDSIGTENSGEEEAVTGG
jgi:hypothetical protein